jgi:chaperonin cofactor prefoldin
MRTLPGPTIDHDQLDFDLKHAPSMRLLKSDSAPLVIGFLHREFKREQRITIPYSELVEKLDGYLESINERQPGIYPRAAQQYLKQWCDEEHRFLRTYTRGSSDDVQVELTADTERALGWVEEMHHQTFIGTESRFLHIFSLLEDIVHKSTEDVEVRLAQLEKQRDAIQREIDAIRETGEMARYSSTQLKERFFQACDVARQLLRDFAAVEQNFRGIARSVQEAQLRPDARKGAVVGYVLDADAALKTSDQGRSFYAFWEFLMSPSKQDELEELLEAVYRLAELQAVSHDTPILRRVSRNLIDAGEKIVHSNHRLAEQLRRMLDERNIAESRRVRELIGDIEQLAVRLTDDPPGDDALVELEGAPDVSLVMEKGLWEPAETLSFSARPVTADAAAMAVASTLDLRHLYAQFYVDELLLRRRIETLLATRPAVTLAEVVELYPVEKGLSEVIAYVAIAAQDERHRIDHRSSEEIGLVLASPEGSQMTRLTIPHVTFRRRSYAS